jgi:hypothetical protein
MLLSGLLLSSGRVERPLTCSSKSGAWLDAEFALLSVRRFREPGLPQFLLRPGRPGVVASETPIILE